MNTDELKIESGYNYEMAHRTGMQPVSVPRGVRVIHLPTGLAAFVNTERSQFKNKAVAIKMIEAGLSCLD